MKNANDMTRAEYTAARDAAIRARPVLKLPPVEKRLASELSNEEWNAARPVASPMKLATEMSDDEYRIARAAVTGHR